MAVPAVGCYDGSGAGGVLILRLMSAKGLYRLSISGGVVRRDARLICLCSGRPGKKYRYFFGKERTEADFIRTATPQSDDSGRYFEAGTMELTVRLYEFQADTLGDFF